MRTSDLLFIFVIFIAACVGGIAMMASHQDATVTTDTFGAATSANVNRTADMVSEVQVTEANYSGYFLLFVALAVIISIIIGIAIVLRKSGLSRGKYRTG